MLLGNLNVTPIFILQSFQMKVSLRNSSLNESLKETAKLFSKNNKKILKLRKYSK